VTVTGAPEPETGHVQATAQSAASVPAQLRGPRSASSGPNVYDAFLSYSHAVDGKLAPALQRGLQRFAKPWYRPRALRIFRDETSLAADPGLWSSIAEALEQSRYLILLASPNAAASVWVAREVEYWCSRKPIQNLLLVLTAGELQWSSDDGDFDRARTSAVPPSLYGVLGEEPRHVDLRWAQSVDQLSLSHPRFRDAVAELAAPLHGVRKEEIAGEEVRQHRRTVRVTRAVALILVVLTAAAVVLAVSAMSARNEAVTQRRGAEAARDEADANRRVAESQRDRAVSQLLASEARARMDTDLDLALLLSVAAYRVQATHEAWSGLVLAAQRAGPVRGFVGDTRGRLDDVSWSSNGRALAIGGATGATVWDPRRNDRIAGFGSVQNVKNVTLSPDGALLAMLDDDREVTVFDVERQRELAQPVESGLPQNPPVAGIAFAPTADTLALATQSGRLLLWDRGRGTFSRRSIARQLSLVYDLTFASDGRHLAAFGPEGFVVLSVGADGFTNAIPRTIAVDHGVRELAFVPSTESLVIVRDGDGRVLKCRIARPTRCSRLGISGAEALAISPSGAIATSGARGLVRIWDLTGRPISGPLSGHGAQVPALEFSPDGRSLVSGGEDGKVIEWWVHGSSVVRRLPPASDSSSVRDIAFLSRNELLVAEAGPMIRVDLSTGQPQPVRQWPVDARALTVGREGQVIAFFSDDGTVVLVEGTRSDPGVSTLPVPDGAAPTAIALSSTAGELAVGTADGNVVVWSIDDREAMATVSIGDAPVTALAFEPTRLRLALADVNGRAALIDLEDGSVTELPRMDAQVSALAFEPTGALVAYAGSDGAIRLADVSRRTAAALLSGHRADVTGLVFTPDGKVLASSDAQGEVRLWDIDHLRPLGEPLAVGEPAVAIDFSAERSELAAAEETGGILLWQKILWDPGQAVAHICAVVDRPLSDSEWRAISPDDEQAPATCD
jgi:WD40 repeat protein